VKNTLKFLSDTNFGLYVLKEYYNTSGDDDDEYGDDVTSDRADELLAAAVVVNFLRERNLDRLADDINCQFGGIEQVPML
jgi:hypothetical protein